MNIKRVSEFERHITNTNTHVSQRVKGKERLLLLLHIEIEIERVNEWESRFLTTTTTRINTYLALPYDLVSNTSNLFST